MNNLDLSFLGISKEEGIKARVSIDLKNFYPAIGVLFAAGVGLILIYFTIKKFV